MACRCGSSVNWFDRQIAPIPADTCTPAAPRAAARSTPATGQTTTAPLAANPRIPRGRLARMSRSRRSGPAAWHPWKGVAEPSWNQPITCTFGPV